MMLLFEPDPPFVRWCAVVDGALCGGSVEPGPDGFAELGDRLDGLENVETVGYLLHQGGAEVDRAVSLLTADGIAQLEHTVRLLPEHNDVTTKAAKYGLERLPGARHVLLCDTAFFASMPPEAGMYAVPYELSKAGLRRSGGFGLCHQWAWRQARLAGGNAIGKLVSVYLSDRTNLAAVQDGGAIETTIGFTPVEGIPSSTGCGDIDPTIIFQLHSTGMLLDQINRLLTQRSGFTGLLDRKCSLWDLLRAEDDYEKSEVLEVYRYSVLKHIGAFIAVLGGVDAVVFVSEHLEETADLMLQICRALAFAGVECEDSPDRDGHCWRLTRPNSCVCVFGLRYDKWRVMAQEVIRLVDE